MHTASMITIAQAHGRQICALIECTQQYSYPYVSQGSRGNTASGLPSAFSVPSACLTPDCMKKGVTTWEDVMRGSRDCDQR